MPDDERLGAYRQAFAGVIGQFLEYPQGRSAGNPEDSDKWHNGYGGGVWFAWLDRANVISATYARSDADNKVLVRAGFAFQGPGTDVVLQAFRRTAEGVKRFLAGTVSFMPRRSPDDRVRMSFCGA